MWKKCGENKNAFGLEFFRNPEQDVSRLTKIDTGNNATALEQAGPAETF